MAVSSRRETIAVTGRGYGARWNPVTATHSGSPDRVAALARSAALPAKSKWPTPWHAESLRRRDGESGWCRACSLLDACDVTGPAVMGRFRSAVQASRIRRAIAER
ncbi:hypothetical protein GCM10010185_06700 [Saccharothrix coeruleofusca]|uniref:Uncharacterized protein n=1 Tax=Saccharothrix coeruleofusca TaxID=33919 RepID=A0A918EC91_9PSEU|nr:hypothetical protein GCM10010185_06700 [Saccharothrix coeruleofusca]